MTIPNALFAGLVLIAATIALVGLAPGLKAAAPSHATAGTWQISTAADSAAWKLNTMSGALFYCCSGKWDVHNQTASGQRAGLKSENHHSD
jgi:hypothetical protein